MTIATSNRLLPVLRKYYPTAQLRWFEEED
jgi:hypothetical protein